MSNETQHPTCLVALRREIGDILCQLGTRLESRVEQVEQAFSSLGWEADQLRSNLKDATLLQESNASLNARIGELESALHTMYTPAQVAHRVNAVHDEVMGKLSAERKELETVQLLLKQAREERDAARSERDLARNAGQQAINERDEARLECQTRLMQVRGLRVHCRAQSERLGKLQDVSPALDILADMVKETQEKLEAAHKQRDDLDKDYGKLVEANEDLARAFEDIKGRYEQLRRAAEGLRPGEVLVPAERLTKAEALHQFKEQAFNLLQCVMNLTTKDISALQYGPHHGHQRLYKHIQAFNRKFAPCFGEREVLRDEG